MPASSRRHSSQTYDVIRDFAPVARLLVMPSILAVNNDVPAKSFGDLPGHDELGIRAGSKLYCAAAIAGAGCQFMAT